MEDLKTKLVADGYTETHGDANGAHYSRTTKVGAPPNQATGLRVDVFVELDYDSNTVSMAVEAHNGDAWCTSEIKGMSSEYAAKHFKTVERRIVYGWRELTD